MTKINEQLQALPLRLRERAIVLANEPAWETYYAHELVEWLTAHNYYILGIEAWQPVGLMPRWLATSHFECDELHLWLFLVECSRRDAHTFIDHFANIADTIFNISWCDEASFHLIK